MHWRESKIMIQRYNAGRFLIKRIKRGNHTRAQIRDLMNKLATLLNTDHAGVLDFIMECQTKDNFLEAIFKIYDDLEEKYLEVVEIRYEC